MTENFQQRRQDYVTGGLAAFRAFCGDVGIESFTRDLQRWAEGEFPAPTRYREVRSKKTGWYYHAMPDGSVGGAEDVGCVITRWKIHPDDSAIVKDLLNRPTDR